MLGPYQSSVSAMDSPQQQPARTSPRQLSAWTHFRGHLGESADLHGRISCHIASVVFLPPSSRAQRSQTRRSGPISHFQNEVVVAERQLLNSYYTQPLLTQCFNLISIGRPRIKDPTSQLLKKMDNASTPESKSSVPSH